MSSAIPGGAYLHSANRTKTYTSIAADIDCISVDPAAPTQGVKPVGIIVWDSGTLKVQYDDAGVAAMTDTIANIVAPIVLPISPRKIISSGTTVTKITILWN